MSSLLLRGSQHALIRGAAKATEEEKGCCGGAGAPGHSHGHGHSHGDQGATGATLGLPEDEDLMNDPTLSQCCIQDREDREKYNKIMGALRKVDPVAKAERLANIVVVENAAMEMTPQSWAREQLEDSKEPKVGWEGPTKTTTSYSLHDRKADNSDDELDAMLEDFDAMQTLSTRLQDQVENPKSVSGVILCRDESSLAQFLSGQLQSDDKSNTKVLIRFVAFTSVLSHTELSSGVTAALEQLVTGEYNRAPVGRAAAAAVEMGLLGRSHALFRSSWFREKSFPLGQPPFIVAFDASGLEPQFGFSRLDLERSLAPLDTWWRSYLLAYEGSSKASRDAEDYKPASSYCGRPGCPRDFPHEHVQRLNKAVQFAQQEQLVDDDDNDHGYA